MKLSNIFEQDSAQAAAMGANVLKKTMGATTSGTMVSKALGKLDQGSTLSGPLAKALSPYADALEKILSDPQYRAKFMQMMKQIQAADKKQQPAQMAAPQESVTEDQDSVDAVAGAVTRRIMSQHLDVLSKYGPGKVLAAIEDVAEFAGGDGLDEIGSSDVSIWTKQVIKDLENGHFDHVESVQEVDEEDPVDTVTVDVPLLLRMMEYAREDAQEDMDLHDVAERMIELSKNGPLSMDDYDSIVGSVEALPAPEEEPVEEAEQIDEISAGLARSAADAAYDKANAARKKTYPALSNTEKKRNIQGRKFDRYANKKEIANEEGYYAPGPETMPGAAGTQEDTNVSFNQTKRMGDASVTVSANAKDMEELHRVLKLAGIAVDNAAPAEEPHDHNEEQPTGEPCPQCGSVDCTCPPGECTCGSEEEPVDSKYTTDKQTLINILKDKLQKRL